MEVHVITQSIFMYVCSNVNRAVFTTIRMQLYPLTMRMIEKYLEKQSTVKLRYSATLTSRPWKSVKKKSLLCGISIYRHPRYYSTADISPQISVNKQLFYIGVWL
jgi:hypothetical protein